ncbi:unnamed protein product [Peniophora sp. CBMAI 1063]|nr:unnamed protein product [Peniophora sp. CBMAI 1063]
MSSAIRNTADASCSGPHPAHPIGSPRDLIIASQLEELAYRRTAQSITSQRRKILYDAAREGLRSEKAIKNLYNDLIAVRGKLCEYESSNAQLVQELQHAGTENNRLVTHVKDLQDELSTMMKITAEKEAEIERLARRASVKDANKRRVAELTGEKEAIKNDLEKLQQAYQEQKAELERINAERASINDWSMVFQPQQEPLDFVRILFPLSLTDQMADSGLVFSWNVYLIESKGIYDCALL